jgi:DNA-binding NarL/FixJ family response regulator
MKKIRIFLIEDNRVLRDGLISLLDGQLDMRVVGSIGSSNDILVKIRKLKPDVMLLDLGLWSHNSRSVLEEVKRDLPEVSVIGMGLLPTQADIIESIEAGAAGFILKNANVREFIATIRTVASGEKVLPPVLAGSLFSRVIENALSKGKGKLVSAVRMTKREREVVALIADGMSNKEIAGQLNIATHTVKSHVHNIMEKLALHTRLQIAKYTHEGNS